MERKKDPVVYAEFKRKDRERKREALKRKKHEDADAYA